MKKNNNSLLMTILGGAVFCFAFLGLAFIFTNNSKVYKNNSSVKDNADVSVGDLANCEWVEGAWSSYTCNNDGVAKSPTSRPTGRPDSPYQMYTQYQNINDPSGYGCNQAGAGDCEMCYSSRVWSVYCGSQTYTCYHFANNKCSSYTTSTPCSTLNNDYLDPSGCTSRIVCPTGYNLPDGAMECVVKPDDSCNSVSGCASGKSAMVNGVCKCSECLPGLTPSAVGTACVKNTNCVAECLAAGGYQVECNDRCNNAVSCGENMHYNDSEKKCVCNTGYDLNTAGTACEQKALSGNISLSQGNTTAYVTPEVCKSYTFHLNYSDGANLPSSSQIEWSVTGADGNTCLNSQSSCTVTVCGKGCNSNPSVKVTATVKLGDETATTPTTTISRAKYTEWNQHDWNKAPSETTAYIYNGDALDHNTCIGYSDPVVVDGVTTYKYRYNRCCGNSSAKCYQDESNVYHWTSSPEPSWRVVSKTQSECKNADACFEKPDGTRVWGKYYDQIVNGYKLITSIGDQETCENPSDDDACYVKADDPTDYKWSPTPIDGYTKVDEITDPETCQPMVCYVNIQTNEYKMGKYENDGNYAKVYDENDKPITDVTKCKAPAGDACYKNKSTGKYVWGNYGNDSNYELITTITNASSCNNEVPVPATGINVSKLIYIFMAILMACGVGFIYYSSVIKKNS